VKDEQQGQRAKSGGVVCGGLADAAVEIGGGLGVLPGAIAKACEVFNVPRPGAGHWTMIRRGWEVDNRRLGNEDIMSSSVDSFV